MIEEYTESITKQMRLCDVCGKKIPRGLACSVARCEICRKDLCEDHVFHEADTFGDFRVVFCEKCWTIGIPFREKIAVLSQQKDELYSEWHSLCRQEKNES